MAYQPLLRTVEGEVIDRRQNVPAVRNRGTVVATEIAGDLRKRRASCAAIRWIGGQTFDQV